MAAPTLVRKSAPQSNPFIDKYEFSDEILGLCRLNEVEKDLVDAPEFQRLFRISQLGFVDLVYQCANHTRGIHSIGTCFWSKRLVKTLNENASRYDRKQPHISDSEAILISMGALLHDISHGPYAHDIEKKSHEIKTAQGEKRKIKSGYGPYEKHDDYEENPVLYLTLLNPELSVVARILQYHSPAFWEHLQSDSASHTHLADFVEVVRNANWPNLDKEILPYLLFHLLVFEKIEFSKEHHSIDLVKKFGAKSEPWGIGPDSSAWERLHRAWYQPYRHDIIGDTLSADLLDYLHRDLRRLGIRKELDLKILQSYVMVPIDAVEADKAESAVQDSASSMQPDLIALTPVSVPVRYRCAIDINDTKRGMIRTERLNELFRLLDLRHEIHEKAVFHRVVQSAIAMMSRALLIMPSMPTVEEIYGFRGSASPALCGEDGFLDTLIKAAMTDGECRINPEMITQTLPQKLAERRVYRPLLVVPGDRVRALLENVAGAPDEHTKEPVLREIAAIVDSRFFKPFFSLISRQIDDYLQHSIDAPKLEQLWKEIEADDQQLEAILADKPPKHVIFWATPYKQLYKDPAIQICVDRFTATIDELKESNDVDDPLSAVRARIKTGMEDSEAKYAALWKMYVFLSDGLFYTGPLAKLKKTECDGDTESHAFHLEYAQIIAIKAIRSAWAYWCAEHKTEKIDLNAPMETQHLRAVVHRLISDPEKPELYVNVRKNVAAGDIRHYAHTENDAGHLDGHCRDVRYKYDLRPYNSFDQAIETFKLPKPTAMLVKRVLESTKREPDTFGKEELLEIINRLAESPKRMAAYLEHETASEKSRAARGGANSSQLLDDIWRTPKGDKEWQGPPKKKG